MGQYGTDDIRPVLETTHTIAVLGAHPDASRPAHYVAEYMRQKGYRIIPVNPKFVGQEIFGEKVLATLDEIDEPVDLVDVFRRSDQLAGHIPEIMGMRHRPRLIWFQSGIRNDDCAQRLSDAGFDVVQDRCLMIDHRRLGIGPPT